MKNKVLFIVSPYFGGASRMTITIAKLLDPEKYTVKFLVYGPKMAEIKNYLPSECEVECLKIFNIWDFATLKIAYILKRDKITHVFSSFVFINTRVALAAKMVGNIRVILRNSNHLSHFSLVDKFLMKKIYPLADVIIAQQEEMKEELGNYIPKIKGKLIALQNILDASVVERNMLAPSPYKNDGEIRFIWMGRVTYTKGYDVLLRAFRLVRSKMVNAELYLLGKSDNDEYYKSLKSYIKENNLEHCVHFLGLLENPHSWVKHAHCFVLPSRMEGLPNALIEAMYIGIPVVSTSCIPIISRMIEDGYNGYIVPVDDENSMALAMIKALNLKNFKMTYKPSSVDEYRRLF